ncbi:hypothetical protein [Streptomyces sp. bgisy159]|uniref:hypothetical protein n=1 Tax=Streptomyces sp. bgisy159 TaxID=3413795 RepID=UPI003F4A6B98
MQRGIDTLTWDIGNSMKADADNYANAHIAETYLDGNRRLAYVIDGWAEGRPDIDTSTATGKKTLEGLITNIRRGHTNGSTLAGKYMVDTTS